MNRRTFLRRGMAGGAVLILGAGGLAAIPTKDVATPTRALVVLSKRSFQVLVAFATRVLPWGSDAVKVVHGVDDMLRCAPSEAHRDFNDLLGLFENALPGLIFDGRVLPFTRLSPAAQDAVLRHWRDSRVEVRRTGYQALRRICLAVAYTDEALWPPIGYTARPVDSLRAIAYDDSKAGVAP